MPRRSGPSAKRPIPHAKTVVAVGSGKGGVGKSTIAGNEGLVSAGAAMLTQR